MTAERGAYSDFSGWVDRPTEVAPALDGEVACDVAIIGGGYTGLAAALRLAERGADAVVLESEFCGWGASSRNAGQLAPIIADPQLLTTVYRRRAAELVRLGDHSVQFTEGLIGRLGIDCEYERSGNVWAALSKGQLRRSERLARMLSDAGGEVEFVAGPEAGLPKSFLGGAFERAGGILNPGKLVLGLREAALGSPARVFEQTAVRAVEQNGGGVVVTAPEGRVRAERVVIATNAYTRDLPFAPKRIVAPVWVTQGETEPIEPQRLDALGWRSRAGIATHHLILENYRLTVRGTVVFGTRKMETQRAPLAARRPDPRVVADLTRGLHERFPSLDGVATQRAWGGWVDMTPSMLPVAGEAAPNVFYAVGYNGHGLAQAPYLGTLLADRVAGDQLHDDLRAIWRARPRFAPAPHLSGPAVRAGWAVDRISDRFS